MTWVAVAIGGSALVAGGVSAYGASKASEATAEATGQSIAAQTEQLNYLKEINELPQQLREEALTRLAGASGLPGGEGTQEDMIARAKASPIFAEIMGGQQAGEEAILRSGSATGMLRSGNTIDAIADDAERRKNQALLTAYTSEQNALRGFADLPTGTSEIGRVTAGIGETAARGTQAQGQIFQQGLQGISDPLMTAAGTYAGYKKTI